jgi:hypothetical protein
VHGLADDVLAQHRSDRGQAVAAARERCTPGALEVEVADVAVGVDELSEQQCAAVTKARNKTAELVPGVALRHRRGAGGNQVADQQAHTGRLRSQPGSRPSSTASGSFSTSSRGSGGLSACQGNGHLGELAREAVT